jgi:hypothetical protein
MKKVLLLCCGLLAAALLIAAAGSTGGEKAAVTSPPNHQTTVAKDDNAYAELTNDQLQAEIDRVTEEILAEKASGRIPSDALYLRLHELEVALYGTPEQRGIMDQGGEDCASATVIPATPYCDNGVYGLTNDCAGTPTTDVFYSFVVPAGQGGTYRVSTCGSDGDSYVRIWDTTCCVGNALTTFDDQCGGVDAFGDVTLVAGVAYFFEVGQFSATTPGAYNFNLFGPIPTAPPVPANDLCGGAIALTLGTPVSGTTRGATSETFTPTTCGTSTSNLNSVWYSVVGNGNLLTASTNNNCTSINSQIKILTGPCGTAMTCVAGNLDFNSSNPLAAVTWCSTAGVTYYIMVSSGSSTASSNGPFTIVITDGPTCDCSLISNCGAPAEVEPNNTCADSANMIFLNCSPNPANYFGTVCPNTDVDYWRLPAQPLGTVLVVRLFEGANCDVPASALVMKAATATGGGCTTATGTATNTYILGNYCIPFTGGWIGVTSAAGSLGHYRIAVQCSTITVAYQNRDNESINNSCGPEVPNLACGDSLIGCITPLADVDWYRVVIPAGQCDTLLIDAYANATPGYPGYLGGLDSYLELYSSDCATQIAFNDDNNGNGGGPLGFDSRIRYGCLTAGTYFVKVRGFSATSSLGSYLLTLSCIPCPCPCSPTSLVQLSRFPVPQYACANLCPGATTQLVVCGAADPTKPPIVTVLPGCSPLNTGCDVDCPPAQFEYSSTGWTYGSDGCWHNIIIGATNGCVCVSLEGFLAVELNSFAAVSGNRSVTLTWSTASEPNNARFEINRDGAKVADVAARGSSSGGAEYAWTDNGLTNGISYTYELVAVDVAGNRGTLATQSATPESGAAVITEYALHQNYPNPFNPTTTITFDLVEAGNVTLRVYNLMGQELATLVHSELAAGQHQVTFDAGNLPSGLYLYRIEANGFTAEHKMLLMK